MRHADQPPRDVMTIIYRWDSWVLRQACRALNAIHDQARRIDPSIDTEVYRPERLDGVSHRELVDLLCEARQRLEGARAGSATSRSRARERHDMTQPPMTGLLLDVSA